MQAYILAAGFGNRLKPLTDNKPKALVEFKGKPLLYHVIEKLIHYGFDDIIINAHYMKEKIISFVNDNKDSFKASIRVVVEDEILGTGGAVKNIENYIKDDFFLVYNVDVMCDIDLSFLVSHHKKHNSLVTMVMKKRETKRLLPVDEECNVLGLKYLDKGYEKIYQSGVGSSRDFGFCGIHILNREIFKYIDNEFSIIDVYLKCLSNDMDIKGYIHEGHWYDVGTIDKLNRAEEGFIREF